MMFHLQVGPLIRCGPNDFEYHLNLLGYALGLLAGNATMISEDFNMTEIFITLTEVIRDNFRNAKLKQHLLPALGEFLFYAATQEENLGCQISQWDAPGQIKQLNNNIIIILLVYTVTPMNSVPVIEPFS